MCSLTEPSMKLVLWIVIRPTLLCDSTLNLLSIYFVTTCNWVCIIRVAASFWQLAPLSGMQSVEVHSVQSFSTELSQPLPPYLVEV